MELIGIAIKTGVARAGMTVEEVFRECMRDDVPGIPFCDGEGDIVGKVSIRYILKETCIQDFIVSHARLLGHRSESLAIPDERVRQVVALPIDELVLSSVPTIQMGSSVVKALATMEEHDTTYIFLLDGKKYCGTVSIMAIARHMIEHPKSV